MPARHDFICNQCSEVVPDIICPMSDPESAAPDHCGEKMSIYWQALEIGVSTFEPFVTRNIHPDGKPLLVRNTGDLKRYYKEYGVIHVPDPDLVAVGSEIRKKEKWNVKASSFVDMGRK